MLCYGCGQESGQVWFTWNGSRRCGNCIAEARDRADLRPVDPYYGRSPFAVALLRIADEHRASHRTFELGCIHCRWEKRHA